MNFCFDSRPFSRLCRRTLPALIGVALLALVAPGVLIAGTIQAGDLVINEVLANPAAVSDYDGEWFELYNTTSHAIDINGWTLSDDDFDSTVINAGAPLLVPASGFLVLGASTDSSQNGGVVVAYDWGDGFNLANTGDEIVLAEPAGVVIDRVAYSQGLVVSGRSIGLFGCPNATSNDVYTSWTLATESWPGSTQDRGSPGAFNEGQDPTRCVPLPGAVGMGLMLLTTLGLIRRFRGTRRGC